MDWVLQDWEYPNDYIYAIERQKEIEASWQQWEEEQVSKNRKPAIIKIVKPTRNETEYKPSTIRGAHQKRS
jgi:hypothetical protein